MNAVNNPADYPVETEQVRTLTKGSDVVVELSGQFTGGEETEAAQHAIKVAGNEPGARVLVDMMNVTYVNSSFIGGLLAAHTSISRSGGSVVLRHVPVSLQEILRVTRLDNVFEMISPLTDSTKGDQ